MKTWKQFSRAAFGLLCVVALAVACAGSIKAQGRIDKYVVSTFNSDFQDIEGTGNPFIIYYPFAVYGDNYESIALPFDFKFDKTTIAAGSPVWVCSNGTVSLGQKMSYYQDEVGSQAFPGALCLFNTESFVTTDGYWQGGDSYEYYEVDGESPNQVLTIEYRHVHLRRTEAGMYGYQSDIQTVMQVKLYESTGVIEYIYRDHDDNLSYDYYSGAEWVGINGLTTPSFAYQSYGTYYAMTPSTDIRFTPPSPPAELSLQPKTLHFGTLLIGQSDTVCTLTASDVGPATLHILGMSMTGAPDYTLISGPKAGDSIQSGQSANFCFSFSPITDGGRIATFTLMTDGGDSANQSATLTGTGAAPRVAFGGTKLFPGIHVKLGGQDSATQYLSVTNTGTGPLNFNSIYPIGLDGGEYYVSYFPQNPLPAGATDSIGITFLPNFEGRSDASFVINSNALNTPHDTVTLLGSGILGRLVINNAYSNNINVNFDSVNVGQTVCQTVTLYNPGSDTVAITRNFISRSDYDFTIQPLTGTDTLIAPEQSRQFTICFTPLRNGFRTATVLVTTNIPLTYSVPKQDTSQFTINLTGTGVPYGHIALGVPRFTDTAIVGKQVCMMDTITNTGTIDITITGAAFSGVSASAFTYSGVTLPITLAPGASQLVTLCGTPAVRGNNLATLTLTGTTNDQPINTSTPLDVVGVSVCASTTPSVAFTNTCVGQMPDTAVITVTNCGDVATAYAAAISGAGAASYSIVPPSTSSVVASNGTATFYVVYTPATPGTAAGTLTITAADIPAMTVQLNGTGTQAAIAGAGTAPVTDIGATSANFDVTVNNTGSCDWTPGPATVSAPFTYVGGGNTVIPAGGSGTLTFTFSPTAAGTFTQNVIFPTPIGSSSSTVVTINGTTSSASVALTTSSQGYRLDQNFPNPFHGQTQLSIVIPQPSMVRLDIVNQAGEVVQSVMNQHIDEGSYTVTIDASNLASGTYYYSLTSGDIRLTRQMLLVK
ncbi:MAG TPA: choice-of-anchor D domain-containing protein [Candidatus Kapabacteria bacterium]|nr:choice-of-anchor D domain-containing protein [Candidatus Kapabacteria bacterium]